MNAERRRIAARYLAEMHNPAVTLPAELPDCTHVWHIFAVRCADHVSIDECSCGPECATRAPRETAE